MISNHPHPQTRVAAFRDHNLAWRVVRQIVGLLGLAIVWFASPNVAEAAPIGMCSELGESIAAPPPLYAASDAEMRACDPGPEYDLTSDDSGQPPTRLAQVESSGEQYVVLENSWFVPRTRVVTHSTAPLAAPRTKEHRRASKRPPQD